MRRYLLKPSTEPHSLYTTCPAGRALRWQRVLSAALMRSSLDGLKGRNECTEAAVGLPMLQLSLSLSLSGVLLWSSSCTSARLCLFGN